MASTEGWILQIMGPSKDAMEKWLSKETCGQYQLLEKKEGLEIIFHAIDDAFRCRLQFDDDILLQA